MTTTKLITAQIGNVSTHAVTSWAVTPQRTAESPREAPTPTMAVVIVCVVDSGIPSFEARVIVLAAADLGGEPLVRLELADPHSHRLDDPPASGHRPREP